MRPNPTAETHSWFAFKAAADKAPPELLIYDYIGAYGVTAVDFDRELKAIGPVANLTLRINSPGGETPTAASIYNQLERFKAKNKTKVTVLIDGIAASAASWIAMLGDEVVMPSNTLMMIHDPAGVVVGGSEEMRAIATVLDTIKKGMVEAYVKKSGLTAVAVEDIMSEETWYSAQEAVDAGFADRVDNPVELAAHFDLTHFKNPPAELEVTATASGATKETTMAETAAEMEARIRTEVTNSMNAKAVADKAIADAAAATKAAADAVDPAAIEARVRAEITANINEVTALCDLAGKPELAAGFIAANTPAANVRTQLQASAKAAPGNRQLNNHQSQQAEAHDDLVVKDLDTSGIWKAYNKGKAFESKTVA